MRPTFFESSTVQSSKPMLKSKRGRMGRKRETETDPYIEFLQAKTGLSLMELAARAGMNYRTLISRANRGVRDIDLMFDLASAVKVDIQHVEQWISSEFKRLANERHLSKKAG